MELKTTKNYVAIKLDMSKAYDRIEWKHPEQTMRRMDFSDKWINLIMECVTSVTYRILVNGSPNSEISSSRGLRQGDLMSPYFFLLSMQSLSNGLKRLEE